MLKMAYILYYSHSHPLLLILHFLYQKAKATQENVSVTTLLSIFLFGRFENLLKEFYHYLEFRLSLYNLVYTQGQVTILKTKNSKCWKSYKATLDKFHIFKKAPPRAQTTYRPHFYPRFQSSISTLSWRDIC